MDIDCVIIGVNAESTLEACTRSVFKSRYTAGKVNAYYVDGGSTDRSVEIARGCAGVHVIEILPDYPTPGLGRNAGWTQGSAPLVQFLDSDTILDPHWLTKAAEAMGQGVGAVRGNREEINPDASIFNWIANLEWNAPPGACEAFGGDVLIRRSILEETGGYDEILVGGEDPELSRRVRLKGWKIIQLDEPMTRHDLAMTTWRQYWKRAYRTGYAYGAVATRSGFASKASVVREFFRILVRGGGPLALLFLALLGLLWRPWSLLLLIPVFGLLFLPRLFRVAYFEREKALSAEEARRYAWHCAFVVVPEFFGTMRFFAGKVLSRPLRNKRRGLQTRRSDVSSVELENL